MSFNKVLVTIGSLLIFITSFLHISATDLASQAATAIQSPFFSAAVKPLWITFTSHLIVFSIIAIIIGFKGSPTMQRLLILIGITPIIDAAMMFYYIGPFLPELMLVAAGMLLITAGLLKPKTK
ncbi:hypothetical protein [Kordiimonas aquimaris]|uniref:hypothetical protein n=1 Tax=Kordiimonas aquimaris TaxID=707591 RepID=UPI0021D13374|nr:hypothetical protein [Kordiimonas aquimaris]